MDANNSKAQADESNCGTSEVFLFFFFFWYKDLSVWLLTAADRKVEALQQQHQLSPSDSGKERRADGKERVSAVSRPHMQRKQRVQRCEQLQVQMG